MNIIQYPSPNYDQRQREIDTIVLHYTDTLDAKDALDILCNPERQVSSHYLVDFNGDIYMLVPEAMRAWHAGVSHWRGVDNINHNSIGIEIVNPGHRYGYKNFTEAQYAALISLISEIRLSYNIPNKNIIAHSDIAPERKLDPGEKFNWYRLYKAGIGLWADSDASDDIYNVDTDSIKQRLTKFGYKVDDIEATVKAFQRHYVQHKVDGVWSNKCEDKLNKLLKLS